MRIELNTDYDMQKIDFFRGTICAVCRQAINEPPAVWRAVESKDFFLHKECEAKFTPEIVKRHIGDLVLAIQDETLHDAPPERN